MTMQCSKRKRNLTTFFYPMHGLKCLIKLFIQIPFVVMNLAELRLLGDLCALLIFNIRPRKNANE